MTKHRKFMKAYEQIHDALVEAQRQRELRYEIVSGEVGWAIYERLVVWGEVNRLRFANALPAIQISNILAVETSASGHSDYTHKYALRAAELVFTEARRGGTR